MNLKVRGINYEVNDDLREYIESRLGFALDQHAGRVSQVSVRVMDVNGPRGGIDKQCVIEVALFPRGVVRVQGTGHNPFALVARTAKRAGQAVHRTIGRRRSTRLCA